MKWDMRSFDHLSVVEKRAALLIGFKWVDRTELEARAKGLEVLRKRLTAKAKGYNAVAAIRRSRDRR